MALVTDDQQCHKEGVPSAWIEDGVLMIQDTGKPIPSFLFETQKALQASHRAEAERLLSEEKLHPVWQMATEDPPRKDLLYIVAKLLMDLHHLDAAERWYLKILEVDPGPTVWSQLAALYELSTDRIHLALQYAQLAAQAEPENPVALRRLGRLLCALGHHGQGIEVLKDVLRRYPQDPASWIAMLCYIHYVPSGSRAFFLDGYRQWGQLVSQGICPRAFQCNDLDPERRLRIGFLSPDLRRNSAAISFEPFLDTYDRDHIEVFAYANVANPDDVTDRLHHKCDGFRNVYGKPALQVAQIIENDAIDILVEIGGHVRDNGLRVCTHKPAPIQVDYGSISTTGLGQIDYRLTDSIIDPPETLMYYVEQSVYLAGGLACFRPPTSSPFVSPLPIKANGHVRFGSFNVNIKICAETLDMWSQVLHGTPGSRLIMKFLSGHDPMLRDFYLSEFARRGVSPDRIEIHGHISHFEHLALVGSVDLVLDTFPYNGCITTLEALWMGVPTVTLIGDIYVSRVGLSILSRLGLEIFAATSPKEYVAKACAFARQWKELEQIRLALRPRMLQSPLCDPVRWARQIEEAFRSMWRRWCEDQKSKVRIEEVGGTPVNGQLTTCY